MLGAAPEAYKQKAIELGQQLTELQRLRRHLLDQHDELPLVNTTAWVGVAHQVDRRWSIQRGHGFEKTERP